MLWLVLILALISISLWKFKDNYTYWQRQGVLQLSFAQICGRIFQECTYKKKSFCELVQEAYTEFPKNKFNGIYQLLRPILVIRDPELIKQLTIKDFDHFVDHIGFIPEDSVWSNHLSGLKGEKWKDMRITLSPAFTSSKMRLMFSLMSDCANDFVKCFEERRSEVLDVDLKDVFTRYTNDVIATCAFGVNCNSVRERENEFYMMGKELTNFFTTRKRLIILFFLAFPKLSKVLGISLFDAKVVNFFNNLILETIKLREEKHIVRPDMINLLMEARKGRLANEESSATEASFATVSESNIDKITSLKPTKKITDNDIIAQAMGFFFAGFDSVAVLMSFMGYELAIHPETQDRLQQEIHEALEENREITYEMVNKMKYLDMVISETLRKWPPAPAIDRKCVLSYDLPSENLKLNEGDLIWIPIWGLHYDPNYFPNPEKFDPERFSEENKLNIKPYTYLPFGVGPRNCIASRFALMEVKIVYIKLLSKFNIVVIDKTPIPMVLRKTRFSLSSADGFWVGLRPRN